MNHIHPLLLRPNQPATTWINGPATMSSLLVAVDESRREFQVKVRVMYVSVIILWVDTHSSDNTLGHP
jgi:hypothetical protein